MTTKKVIVTFLVVWIYGFSFAQRSANRFIKTGIAFHDQGNYEKAIENYQKAIQIDPRSSFAYYEMALSYFNKGDLDKAVDFSDQVLHLRSKYMLQAYIMKGSCLDVLGRTEEAAQVFETAIKDKQQHYLIFYNLSLNYFKLKKYRNAENMVLKGLDLKPTHASSHLLLAKIKAAQGKQVQAMLAAYYFLYLESHSARAYKGIDIIEANFGGYIDSDDSLSVREDSPFIAAEDEVKRIAAANVSARENGIIETDLFIQNTKSLFLLLSEEKHPALHEIWWKTYIPFFTRIAKSPHFETFCKVISRTTNKEAAAWVKTHREEFTAFKKWLSPR